MTLLSNACCNAQKPGAFAPMLVAAAKVVDPFLLSCSGSQNPAPFAPMWLAGSVGFQNREPLRLLEPALGGTLGGPEKSHSLSESIHESVVFHPGVKIQNARPFLVALLPLPQKS